jgi:Ca-activated chloride channel family protein
MRSRTSILFSALPFYVLTALCGVALVSVRAQDAGNTPGTAAQTAPGDNARNVRIYFSARDSKGKIVTDLKADELMLTVDGTQQKISTFLGPEGASPLTLDLLLDVSGSRREELPDVEKKHTRGFFTVLLRPGDLAYVREFADTSKLLAIASADPEVLYEAVSHEPEPYGRTALLQAVYDACTDDVANGRGRKALLLITDGGENHSKVSQKVVENCLRKENVVVLTVATFHRWQVNGPVLSPEDTNGQELVEEFAMQTGGAVWSVTDEKGFEDALTSALQQIRGQYTIEFTGPGPKPKGKPHKMKLETSRNGITLFAPQNMPDGEPIAP